MFRVRADADAAGWNDFHIVDGDWIGKAFQYFLGDRYQGIVGFGIRHNDDEFISA